MLSEYESADSESADEYNNKEETTELLQMESNDDDVIEEQDWMPVDDEENNEVNEAVGSSRTVLSNITEPRQTTSQEHLNSVASADGNTSVLSDEPPSGVLSYDAILPSEDDLKRVTDDFKVIVSRYVLS